MIAAVIRWSARNVFLVGLASIFIGFAGLYALQRVPLDAIPDLSDVQVIIYMAELNTLMVASLTKTGYSNSTVLNSADRMISSTSQSSE